jgi:coenzyme F420-reducing hydrogenase delta subunit
MMRALQKGADGVLVAGCLAGDCHFKSGNTRAAKRVAYVQELLNDIGVGGERVHMVYMSAGQGDAFAREALEFHQRIRALGPSPVKEGAARAA